MYYPQRFSLVLLAMLLLSCGKEVPRLEGVDLDKWKQDKGGCLGHRLAMEPALKTEMTKLKGLAEMDIIALLGKPDQNELYKRNQKFYYYFLSAGPGCTTPQPPGDKLSVRFNAMGYAQYVSISGS